MTTDSQTLILCGDNGRSILGEKSNNNNSNENSIICPPVHSHLKASTISSFSFYCYHAVFITTNGEIFAIGDNSNYQIIGSLQKQELNDFTKFEIKDNEGHMLYPVSAVCGVDYTLYLVSSSEASSEGRLAYTYRNIKTTTPLFFNIGNSNPVSLFGGFYNSAAIDSEGSIIFIPQSIHISPSMQFERTRLPNNSRAVSVACCNDIIYAISFHGQLFESEIPSEGNKLNFIQIESLKETKFFEVSGTFTHCFAITEDGRIFGRGSNLCGQLGFPQGTEKVEKFTEIPSLKDRKIKRAYAGYSHSLFQTEDGKILGCGRNRCGQLFTKEVGKDDVFTPIEAEINGNDIRFCEAGWWISAAFVNCDPFRSPNRRLITEM